MRRDFHMIFSNVKAIDGHGDYSNCDDPVNLVKDFMSPSAR